MVIFFEYGQLGNQLFQYAALKNFFPKGRLVLIGFKALKNATVDIDAKILPVNGRPQGVVAKLAYILLDLFSKARIISSFREQAENRNTPYLFQRGLIYGVTFVAKADFQRESISKKISLLIKLQSTHLCMARGWLEERLPGFLRSRLCFLHIRRGDYLRWPSKKYPAVMPLRWYVDRMDDIKKKDPHAVFIAISDDPEYLRDAFGERRDVFVACNDVYTDLALMTLCQNGILSASSLSWWGAYICRANFFDANKEQIFYAPSKWADRGASLEGWISPSPFVDWITFKE